MDALFKDIEVPQFWSDINDVSGVVLLQGQTYNNPPKYEKFEQFLCSIDGYIQIKLIPHIYRQEVYTGKDKIIVDEDAVETPEN